MMKKNYVITLNENLGVENQTGKISRNSNGSQWIRVELDDWALNEGECLYITFTHSIECDNIVGPLLLSRDGDSNGYVTFAPPELLCLAGSWEFSIELRFNQYENDNGELIYDALTSDIETLDIIDSLITPVKANIVKQTELFTLAKTSETNTTVAVNAAEEAKKAATKAGDEADRAKTNADVSQAAAEEAKEAAKLANSKAIVLWGFNQPTEISELLWEEQ